MNIQDTQALLNIIDTRVKKYINESKLLRQYVGIVTGLTDTHAKYKVKLAGSDTEFTFLNKSGEILNIDDCVYIQTVGTDLNTGIITQKTKEDHNIVDYVVEENIATQLVGQWSYRKWNSGMVEGWCKYVLRFWNMHSEGSRYFYEIEWPFPMTNPNLILTTSSEKNTTASIYPSGDPEHQMIQIETYGNYTDFYETESVVVNCHFYDTWK